MAQRIEMLEAQLASAQRGYESALASLQAAHRADMERQALRHEEQMAGLRSQLDLLIEQIRIGNARMFGARSEKAAPGQLSLFNDMDAAFDADAPEPALDGGPAPKKRRSPRRIDTSNMPTVVIEHELFGEERACPECGSIMQDMKVEVRRVVKLVPAHFEVEEHRCHLYRCPECCELNAQGDGVGAVLKRAEMPNLPIEKSWAHPSLIAGVINSKYVNAMPLYRIQADLRSMDPNMEVSRQCMAGWVIKVWERWLSLIHRRMRDKLLDSDLLHMDETTVLCLKEPGRQASSKSFMWVMVAPECATPVHIFEYRTTRAASVPEELLRGWRGTLMSDCYKAYFSLAGVTNLACLVHIRRHFLEVVKGIDAEKLGRIGSLANDAVTQINRMFAVDGTFDGMPPDERRRARDEKLAPLMEDFGRWLHAHVDEAVPKSKLRRAIENAILHWPHVMNVLRDGRYPLGNNVAERAIRPFVIGRVNWMFSDTQAGARASAALYSIVSTARANGLVPRLYIEWLLTEMPNTGNVASDEALDTFMPWSSAVPESIRANPGTPLDAPDDAIVDVDPYFLDDIEILETSGRLPDPR